MARGRGGRRIGMPGKAYPERTDLNAQPIRTGPSLEYGQGVAQLNAQRAIPLPQNERASLIPMEAPTQRPGEHVMTGTPAGPGAGVEANALPPAFADITALGLPGNPEQQIRALYQAYPSNDLAFLLSMMGPS